MDFWPAFVAYSSEQRLEASLGCFNEELLAYVFIIRINIYVHIFILYTVYIYIH